MKSKVNKWLSHNQTLKIGLLTGALLSIWILAEYIIGLLVGTKELGALYGLLSEIIIAAILIWYFRYSDWSKIKQLNTFKGRFAAAMKIVFPASLLVLVFMAIYVPYFNPELYGLYEGNIESLTGVFYVSVIIGTAIGVIAEGALMGLIISAIFRSPVSSTK